MNSEETKKAIAAERMEFIEILSHQFLLVKGYGIYAYLSVIDAFQLFEQFRTSGIPPQNFAKNYVRSFLADW